MKISKHLFPKNQALKLAVLALNGPTFGLLSFDVIQNLQTQKNWK